MSNQNSINQVILVGRLTRDVELKTSKRGRALREYAQFGITTNEVYRDLTQNQTINRAEFHTVVAWGAKAKFIGTYGKKGKLIAILGKLRHTKYTNKKGDLTYSTQVAVDELTYLGAKGDPVIPVRPEKPEDEDFEEYKEGEM